MSRGKGKGKGGLLGIIILAVIAVVAFGGNKNNSSSSTTRSVASIATESKTEKATAGDTKAEKTTVTEAPTQKPTATPTPTASPTPTPEPTAVPGLKSGSKGEEVTALQELLIQYGYMSGTASGKYDNATVKAVKDFQINNGLKETGKCDQEVWEKITGHPRRQETVYKSKKGKVYHSRSDCSGMKTATSMTLSDALRKGLTPCSHCH